jgi:hypothetical protein
MLVEPSAAFLVDLSPEMTAMPASASALEESPRRVAARRQPIRFLSDRRQLLHGCHAVRRDLLDVKQLLALQPGDADHEEFVEIVARDGEEADALQQRMRGVARLLQHAAVEGQPGKLAIEIAGARL